MPGSPPRPPPAPGAPTSRREPIGREQVEYIASLARLELGLAEAEAMAADLERILGYVEALETLDTGDVEPTSHVIPLPTPLRRDVPAEPLEPDRALANAPDREDDAFVVPKVLDSDEDG